MMRKLGQCEFKGRIAIVTKGRTYNFCKRHAKLFAEGHISPGSCCMTGPLEMRDIRMTQRGRGFGIRPFFEREVIELFKNETKRWKMALGQDEVYPWQRSRMRRGASLCELVSE